ncbi:hypothetical protein AVEN_161090-1, partial [Araneus ventricosus]
SLSGRVVRAPASSRVLIRGCVRYVSAMFDKFAASSSRGDFEACVNLLQTCFTLALLSRQTCYKLADLK